ncbi:MAG: thioredoxin family protein [Chloracidobacterium sp.]|nr:thioredoxin family protein [Chloracidobacterium sp.]
MLRTFISAGLLMISMAAGLAAQSPVSWGLRIEPAKDRFPAAAKLTAELHAEIAEPWSLYALEQAEGGPYATTIKVSPGSPFITAGRATSQNPKIKADPNFVIDGKPLETQYFEKTAVFKVPLAAAQDAAASELSLDVRFQVCNDTMCLPPKTVVVTSAGFRDANKAPVAAVVQDAPEQTPPTVSNATTDVWAFIWLAATFGAISLLTPCVFPMIPITVSFFMKRSDGHHTRTIKLAFVYSVGIIATFSMLGMLLAVLFGASGINLFAANPWVNLVIAAIFLAFAFNLLGFYEIAVPASLLTKLDSISRAEQGRGGTYIAVLLMGLTFTLTSFTCTSPFVGTILVSTAQGDWKMPLLGMLVFSTVFAVPFFVIATVPRLLSSLPRSGGWLNSVKVVMGLLEVAAAMKFLSNVDLVWGARLRDGGALNFGTLLTREVVLMIWIVIGLVIIVYVLGMFRFRNDSPVKKVTPTRVAIAALFGVLCVYMGYGLLGKKLGELESFLPPKNKDSAFNILGDRRSELEWIVNDYEGAVIKARQENKRILIDFTGYTCTNCRWMEANMFVQPEVRAEMERFVLTSLYTDGDGEVYQRQQQMEQEMFGTVALPFYAIVEPDGRVVASFSGLTRDKAEFLAFLQRSRSASTLLTGAID